MAEEEDTLKVGTNDLILGYDKEKDNGFNNLGLDEEFLKP